MLKKELFSNFKKIVFVCLWVFKVGLCLVGLISLVFMCVLRYSTPPPPSPSLSPFLMFLSSNSHSFFKRKFYSFILFSVILSLVHLIFYHVFTSSSYFLSCFHKFILFSVMFSLLHLIFYHAFTISSYFLSYFHYFILFSIMFSLFQLIFYHVFTS